MSELDNLDEEIPLHGGEINAVVRVGDTVRREGGAWTQTIHDLLKHLERVGCDAAPRALGTDERGREVLSFIHGDVTSGGISPPAYMWSDDTLLSLARLLRRLHEATATFEVPIGARWWWEPNASGGRHVICHNDFAPWNIVFRNQEPVGVIDWDLAAPGPATADIAYALWFFVPLVTREKVEDNFSMSIERRAARIRLFCDAYGLPESERTDILQRVVEKQNEVISGVKRLADLGSAGYRRLWDSGMRDGILRDQAFIVANIDGLGSTL